MKGVGLCMAGQPGLHLEREREEEWVKLLGEKWESVKLGFSTELEE